MNVHEVLVAGRNELTRNGWMQKDLETHCFPEGPGGCAYTSMCAATDDDMDLCNEATEVLVSQFTSATSACANASLYRWNDTPGRTEEEVLALFDKAIAETAPTPDLSFLRDEAQA